MNICKDRTLKEFFCVCVFKLFVVTSLRVTKAVCFGGALGVNGSQTMLIAFMNKAKLQQTLDFNTVSTERLTVVFASPANL